MEWNECLATAHTENKISGTNYETDDRQKVDPCLWIPSLASQSHCCSWVRVTWDTSDVLQIELKRFLVPRISMGLRRRLRRTSSVSSDELLVSVHETSEDRPKVRYAKKKKPDSKLVVALQIAIVLILVFFTLYVYHYFEHFHFYVTKFYANHANDHHAQHRMAHHMLKDRANTSAAFEYFRKSADQGHPESAYNLAAGHLSGYKTDVRKGEGQIKWFTVVWGKNVVKKEKLTSFSYSLILVLFSLKVKWKNCFSSQQRMESLRLMTCCMDYVARNRNTVNTDWCSVLRTLFMEHHLLTAVYALVARRK